MASSILRSSFVNELFPRERRVSKDFSAANLCLHRIALIGAVIDDDNDSRLYRNDERHLSTASWYLQAAGFPIHKTPRIQVLNSDPKATPWPMNWGQYDRGVDVAIFLVVNNYYIYCTNEEEKIYQQQKGAAFLKAAVKNGVKVIFVFGDFDTCINTNAFKGEDYVCLAATEEYIKSDMRWNFESEFNFGVLIQSDYMKEIYPHIDRTSRLGRRIDLAMKGEDPTAPNPLDGV